MLIARKLACMKQEAIDTDVIVIGAGPAGLFQLFQLGLHGLRCHVIEALPHVGGQCAQLYPEKPIYDIPAVNACSGLELAQLLRAQLAPFPIEWHLGHVVSEIQPQEDGSIVVQSTQGLYLRAKAVVLAMGVGAFMARPLKIEGAQALLNRQVFMQSHDAQANVHGADVVVYGSDELAVNKALQLAQLPPSVAPKSIHLLHRRDVFKASEAALEELEHARQLGKVGVYIGQLQALGTNEGQLTHLELLNSEAQPQMVTANLLLVYQGISPKLSALAEWGLNVEQKTLPINPATFETNIAGIYAVGDIANYAGKRKLIVSAFHEATLAGYAVAEYVQNTSIPVQFTTTSTKFLQRLGKLPTES